MTTYDVSRIILDYFGKVGECVSAYGICEICKYYNICNTIAIAYRMVLDGEYYG